MIDEQTIKALECCVEGTSEACFKCELRLTPYPACKTMINKHALDLINRQKAKIERKEKLIAEMADYHQKFKAAAKNREKAVVRSVEKAANKEIERLHEVINGFEEQSHKDLMDFMNLSEKYQNEKSEAIKEFAERLKKKADIVSGGDYGFTYEIAEDELDDLVKEMTEKDDD